MTADAEAPTLTSWLLEQIAVDEAAAHLDPRRNSLGGWMVSSGGEDAARMMNLFRPPRVLAECAAKRRIVAMWTEAVTDDDGTDDSEETLRLRTDETHTGIVVALRDVIRALASVYADREGYREEWR